MASSGKQKTTMAKLTRESRLRERRLDKQAKKDSRKLTPPHHSDSPSDTIDATTGDTADATTGESSQTGAGLPALKTVAS